MNYFCIFSKLRVSRSREFIDLSVIGVDEHQLRRIHEEENINQTLQNLEIYQNSSRSTTIHDINTVLNIVYKLDEQLWCKVAFDSSSEDIRRLFSTVSRPYSALHRLSTFAGQDPSVHSLADYGYVYRADETFQNVFNDREIKQISEHNHDPVTDRLLLKNNVNIDLSSSLSYLPAINMKRSKKIITSPVSDFIFSFSEKGLCKIYTANLGLVRVGAINFKEDGSNDVSITNDNKKYLGQLINFEVSNAKGKVTFSAGKFS